MFFTISMLLALELGSNFTPRAAAHLLNRMSAVVILTLRKGFYDCESPKPSFYQGTHLPGFSSPGYPSTEGIIPRQ